MLLSTTAVMVIMSISLGIEFSNSIPLETKVSTGTYTSSDNLPKSKSLLKALQTKNTAIITTKLMSISHIPEPNPAEKPSAISYFLCPKP